MYFMIRTWLNLAESVGYHDSCNKMTWFHYQIVSEDLCMSPFHKALTKGKLLRRLHIRKAFFTSICLDIWPITIAN